MITALDGFQNGWERINRNVLDVIFAAEVFHAKDHWTINVGAEFFAEFVERDLRESFG